MHLSKVAFCTLAVLAARELPQTATAVPTPDGFNEGASSDQEPTSRDQTSTDQPTGAMMPPDAIAHVDWAMAGDRSPEVATTSLPQAIHSEWKDDAIRATAPSVPALDVFNVDVPELEISSSDIPDDETRESGSSEAKRGVRSDRHVADRLEEEPHQQAQIEPSEPGRTASGDDSEAAIDEANAGSTAARLQTADHRLSRLDYGVTDVSFKQHPIHQGNPPEAWPQGQAVQPVSAPSLPVVTINGPASNNTNTGATASLGLEAGVEAGVEAGDRPILLPFSGASPAPLPTSAQQTVQLPVRTAARVTTFPDIQGHWAQDFIEPLAERNVVSGFPDGLFRPNDRLTRAQFAAMIRRAFRRPPVREAPNFADVPSDYWAADAIEDAYRMGFFNGYSRDIFNPEQNISRVETLVSLTTGLDLQAVDIEAGDVDVLFSDGSQVPDYANQSVAKAVEHQLVVNYPDLNRLRPGQPSTRAEAAAVIYQALVNQGILPPLASTASRYIVGYEVADAPVTDDSIRDQFRIDNSPVVVSEVTNLSGRRDSDPVGVPAVSISTPTGFGADWRDIFFGAGFQERTRTSDKADGSIGLGFGIGDAEDAVGLEVAFTIVDLTGAGAFEDGGVSFKLHRQFDGGWAIAAGVENLITFGSPDGGSSGYGVVSKHFQFRDEDEPFSSLTASLGVGGGRFRSELDLDEDTVGVFGSLGLRVVEPVSLITEWTGQDLSVGLSIAPFRNFPLTITPGVADITGNAGDGPRFILGIGAGYSF